MAVPASRPPLLREGRRAGALAAEEPSATADEGVLAPRPAVGSALRARGVDPIRGAGEDAEAFRNRLGTELMALWRDTRSEDSFEALYAFTREPVLHWIRGLLSRARADADAVEVLQDTFVNVYRYPASFRALHAGSYRVWVRTIAGNLVRRRARERRHLALQELPAGLQEPADERSGPEEEVLARDERHRLRGAWRLFLLHYVAAYGSLSPRDRRALHLVEVEGLDYAAAGELLRVTRSNMKMIVFRARVRLARRMRAAMTIPARAAA